jgi:RNA polymerase sigma-70 factor (ECF subfamily)
MTDFDDFYAAHYADLTVQVHAYFGARHEAQDVVQEAFCRALARWRQVSGYDDPAAWVRRVAWNLATSRWRRWRTIRAFHNRQRAEPVVDGPGPERLALIEALAALPAAQRRAMVLHYLADLPVAEIADRERVPRAPCGPGCTAAASRRPPGSAPPTRRYRMPEELTEEQTRAAFADLRAADLTFIRPPGSVAAQRTVRRRRRAGVVAVAAGVGIAIVSTATVLSVVDTDRAAPPPAPPTPSAP